MKPEPNWKNKSIETLESQNYGDLATASTSLVEKCLQYVKIPVGELSVEQLRLLIGQEIGLPYLIPLALEILEKDILAEGDFYEGDLLKNVTTVGVDFWNENPEYHAQLKSLISKNLSNIDQLGFKLKLPEI